MDYEIDRMRVLDILNEKAEGDDLLRLHLQAATWQAIAERLKDKLTPQPQPEVEGGPIPNPQQEV